MSAAQPRLWSGWRLPALGALLLAAEALVAAALHQSDGRLRLEVARGTPQHRIDALQILANRGTPDPSLFGDALVRSLLESPEDRLVEFAFSHEISKFGESELQAQHVFYYKGDDFAHWWRAYVLHSGKVAGGPRLTLQALRWWFDAVEERPPPLREARRSIVIARALAERRRQVLGIDSED